MIEISAFLLTLAAGYSYFCVESGYWPLLGLLLLTLLTRFNSKTKPLGRYVEILFVFCLIFSIMNELGIYYPYSLVLVLMGLIILIFYEGPEWSRLYFGFGKIGTYFSASIGFSVLSSLIFGTVIYFNYSKIQNPVPLYLPLDALVVIGIGFAVYLGLMEEIIFRSFILERAQAAVGANAVVLQGIFFGFMYYRVGVPNGILGAVLGGLFGVGSGYLVKKSESIYLSILAHFGLTLVIFIELMILGKY